MKKQQEQAKAQALKEKEQLAEGNDNTTNAPAPTAPRRSTRQGAKPDNNAESAVSEGRGIRKTKKGQKGKYTTSGFAGSIFSYFKKADTEVKDDNPTVQEALANAADELEAHPTAIGQRQDLVATQQPRLVTGGEMKEYQLEGLEWLKSLWINGLCGILADEMGLGKTVQAISLIAFFKENNIPGPVLICAPLSTVSNWIDEFTRWTPSIKTALYHGSREERAEVRKNLMRPRDQKNADFPVVCTSYEICMNDRRFLGQYQWRYIIVVCSSVQVVPLSSTLCTNRSFS